MVVVIDRPILPLQRADGGRGPALELVVIVAVQQVMLAVVLILHDRLSLPQPRLEPLAVGPALFSGAVSVAAPGQISLRQIGLVGPEPLVDHRLQPRAIGAGLGALDPRSHALAARPGR